MQINGAGNYSEFYRGSESIKSYGSAEEAAAPKDTLVKYEFTESMSKEQALQVMNEISSQSGENVLVEFSGDGLEALSQSVRAQASKGCLELTEEQKAERAEKQALMDKSIVQLENTHRLFIPNIQTNKKLSDSLENAPEHIVKASNGIIKNYLLPHDVSGMTEEQRKDRIAFGLEEAKYLAANYLDEQHAKEFVSAMETIAKYGMNGSVSEDGKVTYHIEQGPFVGAPDDYVSQSDILKEKAPELYDELHELNQSIAKGETGWGPKFIALQKRVNQVLNSNSGTVLNGRKLTNYEEAAEKYKSWKKAMKETKLPNTYSNVNYSDMTAFFDSLQSQGSLETDWLAQEQERFERWIVS